MPDSIRARENGLSDRFALASKIIDPLSKLGGIFLLACYGCGFLTLSIYYSSLGISFNNPFRSQIVAAGFMFLLLTSIPLWSSYWLFLAKEKSPQILSSHKKTHIMFALSSMYTLCILLSFPAQVFFEIDSHVSGINTAMYIGVWLLDAAFWTILVNAKWLIRAEEQHSWIGVIVPLCLFLGWFELSLSPPAGFGNEGFGVRQIALWFLICGIVPLMMYVGAPTDYKLKWPYHLLQVFAFFVAFPLFIYPHISSKWGGGHPVDATISFSKDSSIMPSRTGKFQLIEEDDSGVYILPSGAKRATFIPHSSIGSITFSENASDILR